MAAAILLYVLFCDAEAEAQCYCAASDREQASLVFRAASSMIRKNKVLDSHCKITETHRRVVYKDSFMRAIPANEGGSHGFDSHLIVGDELHTWPNRDFFDTLHTSTGAREQPLEVYVTTAGYDKQSICFEVYERAKAIRDGRIEDPSFLPAIFEAEPQDDWKDPETWAKANPNLGVSVNTDYIEAECKKAIENPNYENTFRRLHLNQWTSQDERWLPMSHWHECPHELSEIELGESVHIGLDLSSVRDFTAASMAHLDGDVLRCRNHYWLPSKRVEYLERKHNISVREWINQGWLTLIEGESVDYTPIINWILEQNDKYNLQSIIYDPWNAHAVRLELEESHGLPMLECKQTKQNICGPTKELERLIVNHKLDTGYDPVLEWMAENVEVKRDEQGNIIPVKGRGKQAKHIDGIVALIMAISEANQADETTTYEAGSMFL